MRFSGAHHFTALIFTIRTIADMAAVTVSAFFLSLLPVERTIQKPNRVLEDPSYRARAA
jgi:hypothetical protein